MKKGNYLGTLVILSVLLLVFGLGIGQAFAEPSVVPSLFNSPQPEPGWEVTYSTPTARPQPVIPNATTGPVLLTTGLKGYWTLDEADTGNRFDSGNSGFNTLTNVNGVGWQVGRLGNASDFERSTSQYLKRESYEAVGLNFSRSLTLVGWVKRESLGQTMALAGKYGTGSANERGYLLFINSANKLQLNVSPDGLYSADYVLAGWGSLASTSEWYHVAGVFDASAGKLRLYLNGNLDAEKTVSYNTVFQSSAPFLLGASAVNGSGTTNHLDGLLDEWQVYNRTLSHSEIQSLYQTSMPIGEVGQVTALSHTPQTVTLDRAYAAPMVFAQPASYNGGDTSVVRITDVQADSFTLYIHEAPDRDGSHGNETVSYLVLEAGEWQLADGTLLEAGLMTTSATVGGRISNQWEQVTFDSAFSAAPVVMSQVQGSNDPHWVSTRVRYVTTSNFSLAMEEEEASTTAHGSETVGWLAMTPGQGTWNGHLYEAGRSGNAVTHNWYQFTFGQGFGQTPRLVTGMSTYDGGDSSHLRYQTLNASGVQMMVEEDTTYDTETGHTTEIVDYLAIEGDGILTASPQ